MTNVNEILRDHVTLTIDCMDRIYLNGYIPNLQVPGQLVNFLTKHRGSIIPSPMFFNMSADFWMNLQLRWDLYFAQQAEVNALKTIHPYSISA